MASNNRSYARAKSTISLGRPQELMKEHIGESTDNWMGSEDDSLTIKLYLNLFVALAQETARLNSVAAGLSAESLWKLGKHKSNLFGIALEKAFSFAKKAGDKAVDGSKLTSKVRQVYLAMTGKKPGEASAVKVEPSADKVEASATKVEASAVKVKEEAMTPVKLEPDQLKAELCQAKGGLCQVKQELAEKSDLELSCLTSPKGRPRPMPKAMPKARAKAKANACSIV